MSDQRHDVDIHVPNDVIVVVFSEVTPQYATDAARSLRSVIDLPVFIVNQSNITGDVRVHRALGEPA